MAIKLKGHETFGLREGWLSKGLKEISNNPKVFTQNYGADALGVGSNMAKAIRYWLKAGEFSKDKLKEGTVLTPIGELILEKDEYLEETFPLWIFHINLAWSSDKATSWYLFFNEIKLEEFTREELTEQLYNKLVVMTDKISERSLRDDITVLLNMYTKERVEKYDPEEKKISPFIKLGLLKKDGNKYIKTQPLKENLNEYVVMYAMEKYFEYKKTDSISIEELLNGTFSPGKVLNIKRVLLNEYIDKLAEQNYLTVNRTAGLDMVYLGKQIEGNRIVKKYESTVEIIKGYYENKA